MLSSGKSHFSMPTKTMSDKCLPTFYLNLENFSVLTLLFIINNLGFNPAAERWDVIFRGCSCGRWQESCSGTQEAQHLLLAVIVLTGREDNRLFARGHSVHSTALTNLQQLYFNVSNISMCTCFCMPCMCDVCTEKYMRKKRKRWEWERKRFSSCHS